MHHNDLVRMEKKNVLSYTKCSKCYYTVSVKMVKGNDIHSHNHFCFPLCVLLSFSCVGAMSVLVCLNTL